MSAAPVSPARQEVDASRLCLACGLCCQGVLHSGVKVGPEEIGEMERLGLAVRHDAESAVFDLPCPRYVEDRCAVYDRRPAACRAYRCKLLGRYLAGEVGWEQSLRLVEQARGLLAALRARLGAALAGPSVWDRLHEHAAAQAEEPEVLLEAASLLAVCQRHFQDRAEPRRIG